MDMPQHLGHFQFGPGQIGDLIQRLLQPLGIFKGVDLAGLAGLLQPQLKGFAGDRLPARGHRCAFDTQADARTVVLPLLVLRLLRPGRAQ